MFFTNTTEMRVPKTMILLFAIVLLGACSSNESENKNGRNPDAASEEKTDKGEGNKEYSGSMIDKNTPLEEREAIEKGMELQKDLLNLDS